MELKTRQDSTSGIETEFNAWTFLALPRLPASTILRLNHPLQKHRMSPRATCCGDTPCFTQTQHLHPQQVISLHMLHLQTAPPVCQFHRHYLGCHLGHKILRSIGTPRELQLSLHPLWGLAVKGCQLGHEYRNGSSWVAILDAVEHVFSSTRAR